MYTPITSIFFRALEADFRWSKTVIAAGLLALPLTGIASCYAGRLIDRFGVRRIALLSAIAMATSFFLLSLISCSLLAFYIGFIGFNVLGCATAPVSYIRPVATRFSAKKGMAIVIALSGISVSGILLSPLLGSMLAHGEWRAGYRLLAAIALIGGLIAVALIRPTNHATRVIATEGLERRDALRTREFWQLGLVVFLAGAASVGMVSQLQTIAVEYGTPVQTSGLLLAISHLPSSSSIL